MAGVADYPDEHYARRIKEAADKWGFVAQSLGLVWRD